VLLVRLCHARVPSPASRPPAGHRRGHRPEQGMVWPCWAGSVGGPATGRRKPGKKERGGARLVGQLGQWA
jgi:hypothetical protein